MPDASPPLRVRVNEQVVTVAPFSTVAAALAIACPEAPAARSSTGGERRFALCGMGVCQECRVAIDGRAHCLACQTLCEDGMSIATG